MGGLFCKGLVPLWSTGLFSIHLIKGSLDSITPKDWALLSGMAHIEKHRKKLWSGSIRASHLGYSHPSTTEPLRQLTAHTLSAVFASEGTFVV